MNSILNNPNYPIIQLVLYLLQFYIMAINTSLLFKPRFNKVITYLSVPVFWYISIFPKHFVNAPEWANSIIFIFVFLWMILMVKGKKSRVITNAFFIIFIAFLFSDIVTSSFIIIFWGSEYFQPTEIFNLSLYMFFNIIFNIIYFYCFRKATHSINTPIYKKIRNFLPLLCLIILEIIFFVSIAIECIIYNGVLPQSFSKVLTTLILIFSVMFLFADIIVFSSIKNNARLQKLEADYRILEYQNILQSEYYEKMQKSNDTVAKIRHDINNLVQVINFLLEENTKESREKAAEIVNEIDNIMSSTRTKKYCNNRIINTVLFDKSNIAKQFGIKISDDIILDELTGIESLDLCRIFVNLLDNAINAVKKYNGKNNKTIFISCKKKNDYIYIKAENPFDNLPDTKKNNSTEDLHGFGMKIIEEITTLYNGTMIVNKTDDTFSVLTTLKTDKAKTLKNN